MTSNGLSHRRAYLKRPIVCKASPNPPVEEDAPPDNKVCTITLQSSPPFEPDDEIEFELFAFDPDFDQDLILELELIATQGEWIQEEELPNGESTAGFIWWDEEFLGFVKVGFIATFPDESTCRAEIIFEVTEGS